MIPSGLPILDPATVAALVGIITQLVKPFIPTSSTQNDQVRVLATGLGALLMVLGLPTAGISWSYPHVIEALCQGLMIGATVTTAVAVVKAKTSTP